MSEQINQNPEQQTVMAAQSVEVSKEWRDALGEHLGNTNNRFNKDILAYPPGQETTADAVAGLMFSAIARIPGLSGQAGVITTGFGTPESMAPVNVFWSSPDISKSTLRDIREVAISSTNATLEALQSPLRLPEQQ